MNLELTKVIINPLPLGMKATQVHASRKDASEMSYIAGTKEIIQMIKYVLIATIIYLIYRLSDKSNDLIGMKKKESEDEAGDYSDYEELE